MFLKLIIYLPVCVCVPSVIGVVEACSIRSCRPAVRRHWSPLTGVFHCWSPCYCFCSFTPSCIFPPSLIELYSNKRWVTTLKPWWPWKITRWSEDCTIPKPDVASLASFSLHRLIMRNIIIQLLSEEAWMEETSLLHL